MICYCICGFRLNVEEVRGMTGKEFLEQFNLFVRSMGIHGKLPYLYPMYGAADITQVFSRIGAVYGGHFVLDKHMKVQRVALGDEEAKAQDTESKNEKPETGSQQPENETEEAEQANSESNDQNREENEPEKPTQKAEPQASVTMPNKLTLTKGSEQMEIGFGKLICGPEYNRAIMELTGQSRRVISERVMQTVHVVLKCNVSIESEKVPAVMVYPEGNQVIGNQKMIRANVLSWNTKSTPLEFVYVNISFELWEGADLDLIRREVVKDAQIKVERELTPKFHFSNKRVYR